MRPAPVIQRARLEASWAERAATCLSAAEEARAGKFRFALDRDRWRAGRAWVRHRLAEALGRGPVGLEFVVDERGRPRVAGAPPGFDCNWSHSGEWIALAVSRDGPVGVDVEVVRADFPAMEVAACFFTPAETAVLGAVAEPVARQRLFFRLWTAKEALMKATGLGVALEPAQIEVTLREHHPHGYASHPSWRVGLEEEPACVMAWTWGAGRGGKV